MKSSDTEKQVHDDAVGAHRSRFKGREDWCVEVRETIDATSDSILVSQDRYSWDGDGVALGYTESRRV